jgi:hypothetical protein
MAHGGRAAVQVRSGTPDGWPDKCCHPPQTVTRIVTSRCRRKIEMTPGAQVRRRGDQLRRLCALGWRGDGSRSMISPSFSVTALKPA